MTKIELQQKFDEVADQLLERLSSLDQEQLNRVPFPGSWTAGQVGDHLYRSYAFVQLLHGQVEECNRPPDQKLAPIKEAFEDFSIKMKSPEEILPATQPITKADLLVALQERLNQQREALITTDLTKVCLDYAIPENGYFTRLEWLGFSVIHTRRHLHQLGEIIAIVNDNHAIKLN